LQSAKGVSAQPPLEPGNEIPMAQTGGNLGKGKAFHHGCTQIPAYIHGIFDLGPPLGSD
jgi:hypothetical protein